VVAANLARGSDGRWSALHGYPIFQHAKAAGSRYQRVRAEAAEHGFGRDELASRTRQFERTQARAVDLEELAIDQVAPVGRAPVPGEAAAEAISARLREKWAPACGPPSCTANSPRSRLSSSHPSGSPPCSSARAVRSAGSR
jgi:hypothetical protein